MEEVGVVQKVTDLRTRPYPVTFFLEIVIPESVEKTPYREVLLILKSYEV